uniref:hypothetical protein n=1 Tax=Flavobacterium sp. TaxID=239 RepID=UPI00404B4B3E
MKKRIVILVLILGFTHSNAQKKCVRGNCKDNFSFEELADGYQVGFYTDSQLHGFGVEVKQGEEYFGSYTNGKKEGLFYYKVNGEMAYGNFKNNLPIGLHVVRIETGYDYKNYNEKGIFINRTPIPTNGIDTGCIQGNCLNGYGVINENNNFFAGNFVNGKLEGIAMLYRTEEQRIIYCEMKNGVLDGVSIVLDFDGKVSMYNLSPKRQGQGLVRSKELKYNGYMFKDNEITATY